MAFNPMMNSLTGYDSGSAPKRMRLSDEPSKPSRVLHIHGLPNDATEAEIISLTQLFGQVNNIILTRSKNQALVEMTELEMAKQMVEYYRQVPARIRSNMVHVQFSNHENLRVEQKPTQQQAEKLEDGSGDKTTQSQQHTVLRVIVDNMVYPVTLDALYAWFSKYGNVLRIITFTKNNSFHALIEFEDSLQAQNAKMSLNGQSLMHGYCSLHIDFSKLQKLSVRYNNTKSRDFTNDMLPCDEDPNYTMYPPAHSMRPQWDYGPMAMPMMGRSKPPPTSPVILVSNLNAEKVTPDSLFTLFGCYGDVVRVKILFNKQDTALIQFTDSNQAQRAIDNLDFVRVWNQQMKLSMSKMHVVQMPKEGQPGAELTQDYSKVPQHRLRFRGAHVTNTAPPSDTLFLNSIPADTTEAEMKSIFSTFGTVVDFKFFDSNSRMALIQMKSTEEAVMALIGLHNFKMSDSGLLIVSFTSKRVGHLSRHKDD